MTKHKQGYQGWMLSLLAVIAACTTGAGGGSNGTSIAAGTPESKAAPMNAASSPAHPGIEGCATGNVSGNLEIVADLEQSYHEMVVCGGLTASFTLSFVNLIIHAAFGKSTGAGDYTFDGKGHYNTGGVMDLSLYLADDTAFGKAGDLITFDVFQLSNYFLKATFSASASFDTTGKTSTQISVGFESPGPGAELLGVVPGTASPIKLNFDDVVARLGRLQMKGDITVMNKQRETNTQYVLLSSGGTIADVLGSRPITYQLVQMTAARAVSGQTVTVKNWGMNYQAGGKGTLDGSIAVDIAGGAFPYSATFGYPHRRTPDVTLSCMGAVGKLSPI